MKKLKKRTTVKEDTAKLLLDVGKLVLGSVVIGTKGTKCYTKPECINRPLPANFLAEAQGSKGPGIGEQW